MPRNKRLHFKDVNTLRFLAFIPVFFFSVLFLTQTDVEGIHVDVTHFFSQLSLSSLDFYFFISAFLIASQGLRELKYTEVYIFKNFFFRRLLRILPLFIFLLLFTFLVHPWIMQTLKLHPLSVAPSRSYWFLLPNYFADLTKDQYVYLIVLWTIYMFIQFQLVWGLIIRFFRENLKIISLVFIGIGITARLVHYFSETLLVFDTLSYCASIGMGGLIALAVRNESAIIDKIKNLSKSAVIGMYISGLVFILFSYFLLDGFLIAFIPVLTCSFFGFILIEQTFGKNSFKKFRDYKIMAHLGKISYGLIVYQGIVTVLVSIAIDSLDFDLSSNTVKGLFLLVSFAASWIMADVSYTIIEKPLLRLRREFKKI